MGTERAEELIKKFLAGKATSEEVALLDSWYIATAQNQQDLSGIPDYPRMEAEMLNAIQTERQKLPPQIQPRPVPRIRPWFRIVAAAAVLIIISVGGFFIFHKDSVSPVVQAPVLKNDILPAGTRATLTLLDGRTIALDSADNHLLARQENAELSSLDGQLIYHASGQPLVAGKIANNTLTTRQGEHYSLILGDGTRVWLNAGSSIRYPAVFNNNERRVEITGEVYFEIVHNARQPFKIGVKDELVEDIGTHINIQAYDDESAIHTALIEGSIKVSKGTASAILVPGQEAILRPDASSFQIKQIDTTQALSWKNGYFYFDHADLKTVMRELARWYDVQIVYQGEVPKKTFKGKLYRNINVTEALGILSYFGAHFHIGGRTITVTS